ncbi:glycerophosphodiester phosphodiesterase [Panacibacter sp. DH6]|uniref:Glycerophosphodiester phosphodiesterase n=1 Tax=Panacibacter microcysteis TaxID=2793269 RepID=A0A931E2S2_9BACT|nr:hypothetical protein [Panacibacter microcysteis]MBG9376008.1 glycerophosphodiester phosphodiesterase [Panacibacter microcysteis]
MKNLLLLLLLLLTTVESFTQSVLIHSHNDYAKPQPLVNALKYKAYIIEADVYPGKDLFVAHDKKDIDSTATLLQLYILPVVQLFNTHNNHISDDTTYALLLMIDIKENSSLVLNTLVRLLAPYPAVFNRHVNKHAIQVVISGERGNSNEWNTLPPYIMFDGRPYEQYDTKTLERVALISDSYMNYMRPADSLDKNISNLVTATHEQHKLLRLWAIPDSERYWLKLHNMGVDIINTDKVAACAAFFGNR